MIHPQTLGATMATAAALAFSQTLALNSHLIAGVSLSAFFSVLIYLSEARTAGAAIFLSVTLAFASSIIGYGRNFSRRLPTLSAGNALLLLIALVVVLLLSRERLETMYSRFVSKGDRANVSDIFDAYMRSRGKFVERMQANAAKHLWTGMGFGVASNPTEMKITYDPFFKIPINASVEKGNTYFAIFEETGLPGAMFTCIWLVSVGFAAFRAGFPQLTVFFCILFLNFGEATLFSAGGFGLLQILLFGWCSSPNSPRTSLPATSFHSGLPHRDTSVFWRPR
jgi:hypothetical protein